MELAKVIPNGRSQAVRLPKECRFDVGEVVVKKIGKIVMLVPKDDLWDTFVAGVFGFSDDFLVDREQGVQEERELL